MNDQTLANLLDEFRKDIAEGMQKENIPGLSIAITDAKSTLWEASFGVTSRSQKQPVTSQLDGYGLGIAVNRHHGTRRYTHSGGGFGFLSDMLWYPELSIGIVVLTNSVNHHLQWWYANRLLDQVLDLPEYKSRLSRIPSTIAPAKAFSTILKSIEGYKNLAGQYMGRLPAYGQVKQTGEGLTIRFGWDKKPKPLHFYAHDEAYVQNNDGKPASELYSRIGAGLH